MADITVVSGGKDFLDPAADMMSEVFKDDPVIRYMQSSLSDDERHAYMREYMRTLFKAAAMNDGIIQNINDWECCAIWMLPGRRIDNPLTLIPSGLIGFLWNLGLGGIKRTLIDVQQQSDRSKRKGLKGIEKYHYLFFIGTAVHAQGKGIAKKVIRKYQAKAQEEGLPIWLEATTSLSRDIYTKCGFELIDEIRLGEGTHDVSGAKKKGGPGLCLWAMIWRPAAVTEKSASSPT